MLFRSGLNNVDEFIFDVFTIIPVFPILICDALVFPIFNIVDVNVSKVGVNNVDEFIFDVFTIIPVFPILICDALVFPIFNIVVVDVSNVGVNNVVVFVIPFTSNLYEELGLVVFIPTQLETMISNSS